jgi:hypothetical protein
VTNPFARHVPRAPIDGVFSGEMHSDVDGSWAFEGRFTSPNELLISVSVLGDERASIFRGKRGPHGWLLVSGPRVLRLTEDLTRGVWTEPGRPPENVDVELDEEDDDDEDGDDDDDDDTSAAL